MPPRLISLSLAALLASPLSGLCTYPDKPAPAPEPAPVSPPQPQPQSPPKTVAPPPPPALDNSTRDQLGRTLTPEVDQQERFEKILGDTVGSLMNRSAILQNTLNENPELAEKVSRWLRARERMNRAQQAREARRQAKQTADRMRQQARDLRRSAHAQNDPKTRASLESAGENLDRAADGIDKGAETTREQKQENRDAKREFDQASSDVPDHIKSEVDNALNEQNQPQQHESQQRAEVGPDGEVIETTPGN